MRADNRILSSQIPLIRRAIEEADGDEVVFACHLDDDGLVSDARAVATGTGEAAPAPLELLRRGGMVIHNHPSGVLRPSEADVSMAAELADYGAGFAIINNEVTEITVVCEPAPERELAPLDVDLLAKTLDDGGVLSETLEHFESREAQIEMLRRVALAFNDDEVLAVEAGTGVGKSFAYLIPALTWAAQNEERVVISTATINLQQQLVEKDIPAVCRFLGLDVPVMLMKGRGNYLCRRRLRESISEATLFDDPEDEPEEELVRIREWAETSTTGDRSDVPFHPSDDLWSSVNSDADSCTEFRCPLRESCFFLAARRQAANARVLVANHHLLFIDLSLRIRGIGFNARAILPPFQRIIFDEAHSIEASATSLFSESFSLFGVRKHTRRLHRTRKGRQAGLLSLVRAHGADADKVNEAVAASADAARAAVDLDAAVIGLTDDLTLRLVPGMDTAARETILGATDELGKRIVRLSGLLADLVDQGQGADEEGPFYDLRVTARRIERLGVMCRNFVEFDGSPDRVFWIDFRRASSGKRFANFVSTPLDISDIMREAVYEAFDTVVFTSATLTVGDSFDFWASRIGLPDAGREPQVVALPSPFAYTENALLGVPSDAPEPGAPDYQEFLSGFLGELLELTEGRALVLFTSYAMLRATHEAVRNRLSGLGIAALRQGEDDRARLLRRFNEDVSSVLFATESFWQGVDAPGETLKVVVLCRLPFRVPTDPVLTARTELIEARGGNAFAELALPEAVMKLRQGFGRLIRRATDTGAVIITDTRFVTRPYGELFRRSLPRTQESVRSAAGILEDVERFLYG